MSYKFIYDSIHKQMPMHPIVLKIINTFPFQRLRYLKQLGVADHVFPSANHTRFEHSIGVSYLAGKLIRCIQSKQPELEINDDDILKVEIAGLCHDLGHGPYSHSFDKFLEMSGIKTEYRHHEKRSCMILDYLVNMYYIPISKEILRDIKDLIHPVLLPQNTKNKKFMYHIISNPDNGIDVDKFDYMKRDAHYLGLPYSIDLERLLETARVIDDTICYPEKMIFSISNIYEIRSRLHKEIYTHPVVYAIELMLIDMLKELHREWDIYISEPELFLELNDSIINQIDKNNIEAFQIRQKIWERELYKYVGQTLVPVKLYKDIDKIIDDFYQNKKVPVDDVILKCVHIGSGKNPLQHVRFYNVKKDMNKSFVIDESKRSPLLPNNFEEKTVRVYVKDKKMKAIGEYYLKEFERYLQKK